MQTYRDFVDYETLGVFKRMMLDLLEQTAQNLESLGIRLVPESIGEPAALFDFGDFFLAFKSDGVGTKNLVGDAMYGRFPDRGSFYNVFALDLIAMNVNDLLCVGATPFALSDEVASGAKEWFTDESRLVELVNGFDRGCKESKIVIPCGETPTLPGIVVPGAVNITGSSLGIVKPKDRVLLGDRIEDGDVILGFASSGLHANGFSLARSVVESLPDRYETPLDRTGAGTVGEALLVPTRIYASEVLELFRRDTELHYLTNITGGGWQKIKRCRHPFRYVIGPVPMPPPIFTFLLDHNVGGPLPDAQAYQTYNMGIGFVLIVPERSVESVTDVGRKHSTKVYRLGHVEEGPREVVIPSLNITY